MSARIWIALAALHLGACACGEPHDSAPAAAQAQSAGVRGTVVDAATREPVSGVSVTAPDGSRARSDEHGRFELSGLAPGLHGELRAEASGGRSGSVPLRPLRAGVLEVVVHLHSP